MVNCWDIFRVLIKSDWRSQTKVTRCPKLAWWVLCLLLLGYRHPFMPSYSKNVFAFIQFVRALVNPIVSSVPCSVFFRIVIYKPQFESSVPKENIGQFLISLRGGISFCHWQFCELLLVPCSGSGNGLAQQLLQLFLHACCSGYSEGQAALLLLSRREGRWRPQPWLWANGWHLPNADDFRNVQQKMCHLWLHACLLTGTEDLVHSISRTQDKQTSQVWRKAHST